jgi:uncharacterized protein YcnI
MTLRTTTLLAAIAAALAVPAGASAHVTVQPPTAEAGSFTVQNVRVPNESENESVRELRLQMPAGFETVRTAPVPGWEAEVTREGEAVSEVVWTAEDDDARIAPGEFLEFPISVRIPDGVDELVYKAIETYDGSKVSRWIGAPESDNPAPVVTVTPASAEGHGGASADDAADTAEIAAVAPVAATDDDGDTLAIVALVVGALGLLAGGAALVLTRRRPA